MFPTLSQKVFYYKSHNSIFVCKCFQFGQVYHFVLNERVKHVSVIRRMSQRSCYAHAEPHSSVSSITDLHTGGRWFDPWLSQYSFQVLMIVIATGFIPLSPLSIVSTVIMWESSQWLGKNIMRSPG